MTPENLQAVDTLLVLHGYERSPEIGGGYLISRRGMHGGYWFSKDYSLADVVKLMQSLNECLNTNRYP